MTANGAFTSTLFYMTAVDLMNASAGGGVYAAGGWKPRRVCLPTVPTAVGALMG